MNSFSLFNKFTVQEGKQDSLVEILLSAAEGMKNMDECELYLVNTADGEPDSVYVYEVWRNEAAHRASLSHESAQTLIRHAKPMITGIERITTLTTRGGKGISSSF